MDVNKREWLADKGLAKRDGRGKFSFAAIAVWDAAIASGDITERPIDKTAVKSVKHPKPVKIDVRKAIQPTKTKPLREQTTVWALDKGNGSGRSDIVIAFDYCSACAKSIRYCIDDFPQLPKFVGGGNALMVKPSV